jgi:hypothetical protein
LKSCDPIHISFPWQALKSLLPLVTRHCAGAAAFAAVFGDGRALAAALASGMAAEAQPHIAVYCRRPPGADRAALMDWLCGPSLGTWLGAREGPMEGGWAPPCEGHSRSWQTPTPSTSLHSIRQSSRSSVKEESHPCLSASTTAGRRCSWRRVRPNCPLQRSSRSTSASRRPVECRRIPCELPCWTSWPSWPPPRLLSQTSPPRATARYPVTGTLELTRDSEPQQTILGCMCPNDME